MKIYTRKGDQGTTSLYGNDRVLKNDLRIVAYGTIDELNAMLGLARSEGLSSQVSKVVLKLQNQLFALGAELASPNPQESETELLSAEDVAKQEATIDEFEKFLPPLTNFILPGGICSAATLHLARCICRRAEREIVALNQTTSIRKTVLEFINRTSDLLFVLARVANAEAGTPDIPWKK